MQFRPSSVVQLGPGEQLMPEMGVGFGLEAESTSERKPIKFFLKTHVFNALVSTLDFNETKIRVLVQNL